MSSPLEVLAHVRATHRSAVLERMASMSLPIWSRIVLPIVAVLATILLLSTCVPPLRRLVRHCTLVLLNGKRPLRWLGGLLFGMAPPLVWTFAFKQARRIPDEIRPMIHTTVLPVVETFLLSPLGVFLSMTLMSPLAFLVWLRYHRRKHREAVLYPTVLIMFPPTLRILNDLAIGLDPSPVQDVTAWIFYGVLHFASPFLFGWWFWFFASPGAANIFGWCLGLQNLSGLILHVLNPHAAPWFHDVYPAGTIPNYSFPGNAAGLVRVDEVLGTHLYSDGFRRGPVVFGAIPSLHAATAACCSLFVARYGGARGAWFMVVYFSLMCWSTMYFHHHFAVDLVAGAGMAILFFSIFAHFCLRPLDQAHILEGTTRGVDRLFCWGPPVLWKRGYGLSLMPPYAREDGATLAVPSFYDVDEEVQLVKVSSSDPSSSAFLSASSESSQPPRSSCSRSLQSHQTHQTQMRHNSLGGKEGLPTTGIIKRRSPPPVAEEEDDSVDTESTANAPHGDGTKGNRGSSVSSAGSTSNSPSLPCSANTTSSSTLSHTSGLSLSVPPSKPRPPRSRTLESAISPHLDRFDGPAASPASQTGTALADSAGRNRLHSNNSPRTFVATVV